MENTAMLIVGAGHSGGRAALSLRQLGFEGPIHLIGDEAFPPYERPPLSKSILTRKRELERCFLADDEEWAAKGITRHHAVVQHIDTAQKAVLLNNGERLSYHSLLLATGGKARQLRISGHDLPHVYSLRHADDALAVRERLHAGQRICIIGGGFIGLEVAASAIEMGCQVTLVETAAQLLGRAVPKVFADQIEQLHRTKGVHIHLNQIPQQITSSENGLTLTLDGDQQIHADTIIVGIGIEPNIELAKNAGLQAQSGVIVDEQLRSSDPHIYASGDVAQFPSQLDGQSMRQETWTNAETQAKTAAANMLGGSEIYQTKPWFWTDQYDHQLQVSGEPTKGQHVVFRHAEDGSHTIAFYLNDDHLLVGSSAWGVLRSSIKEFKIARTLVERHQSYPANQLSDPAFSLKSLL